MSKFDTQIHSDYVDAQELDAIEAEADEADDDDDADGHAEDNWTHTSYDDIEEILLQYDEERDIDFYSS